MEQQSTIDGKILLYPPQVWGIYLKHWNQKNDKIWLVLRELYMNVRPLSSVEIGQYIRKKEVINDKSIEKGIKRLVDNGFIKLLAKGVGPTKRRNYYIITDKGSSLYEMHINK